MLARTIHANELAVALKTHARLPEPFITLKQATALGFPGKPLAEIAPGKAIGGDDVTAQVKGHLPMIEGRTWTSADVGVDYTRPGRKGLRLLFSNDGLLYIAPESLKPAQPFGRYKSAGRALAGRSSGKVAPSRTSLPQETPASSKQVGEMLKGLADAPKLRQEMAAKMVLHYTARTLGVSVGPKGPLEGIAICYNPKLAEGGQFIVTGKAGQRQGTIVIGPHTTMRALLEEIVHAIDFNRSIRTSKASKPVGSFVAQHYIGLLGRSDTPLTTKVMMAKTIAGRELGAIEAMLGLDTPLTQAHPSLKRISAQLSERQRAQLRKDRQYWRNLMRQLDSPDDGIRSAATAEVPRGHFMKIRRNQGVNPIAGTQAAASTAKANNTPKKAQGHDLNDRFEVGGADPNRVAPVRRTDPDGSNNNRQRNNTPDAAWAMDAADQTHQIQKLEVAQGLEHHFSVHADGRITATTNRDVQNHHTIQPQPDAQGIKRFNFGNVDYELSAGNKVLPAMRDGQYDGVGILAQGNDGPRSAFTTGAADLAGAWGSLSRTAKQGNSQIAALRKLAQDTCAKHPWKIHAPDVELVPASANARGLGGTFDPVRWTIRIYIPGDDGRSALNGDMLKNTLKTLIHEMRHADQFWSRTLYLVAKQVQSGTNDPALTAKAGVHNNAITAARAVLGNDVQAAQRFLASPYGEYGKRWARGAGELSNDGKSLDIMSQSVRLHKAMDDCMTQWNQLKGSDPAGAQKALERYNALVGKYNKLQDERNSNRAEQVVGTTIDTLQPTTPLASPRAATPSTSARTPAGRKPALSSRPNPSSGRQTPMRASQPRVPTHNIDGVSYRVEGLGTDKVTVHALLQISRPGSTLKTSSWRAIQPTTAQGTTFYTIKGQRYVLNAQGTLTRVQTPTAQDRAPSPGAGSTGPGRTRASSSTGRNPQTTSNTQAPKANTSHTSREKTASSSRPKTPSPATSDATQVMAARRVTTQFDMEGQTKTVTALLVGDNVVTVTMDGNTYNCNAQGYFLLNNQWYYAITYNDSVVVAPYIATPNTSSSQNTPRTPASNAPSSRKSPATDAQNNNPSRGKTTPRHSTQKPPSPQPSSSSVSRLAGDCTAEATRSERMGYTRKAVGEHEFPPLHRAHYWGEMEKGSVAPERGVRDPTLRSNMDVYSTHLDPAVVARLFGADSPYVQEARAVRAYVAQVPAQEYYTKADHAQHIRVYIQSQRIYQAVEQKQVAASGGSITSQKGSLADHDPFAR
ncbi:MAG: hypothetical protein AAFX99_13050 [Myxococcota bacterium]